MRTIYLTNPWYLAMKERQSMSAENTLRTNLATAQETHAANQRMSHTTQFTFTVVIEVRGAMLERLTVTES